MPSDRRAFRAPEFSLFLFKLKAPHNAICGFAVDTAVHPQQSSLLFTRSARILVRPYDFASSRLRVSPPMGTRTNRPS